MDSYSADAEGHDYDQQRLVANYGVRIFDENFNELNVDFGEDGDSKLANVYIIDADGNDIGKNWKIKQHTLLLQ